MITGRLQSPVPMVGTGTLEKLEMEKTVTLAFVKSTVGTHVYGEVGKARSDAIFPALYLPKSLFPNGAIPSIEVTIKIPS